MCPRKPAIYVRSLSALDIHADVTAAPPPMTSHKSIETLIDPSSLFMVKASAKKGEKALYVVTDVDRFVELFVTRRLCDDSFGFYQPRSRRTSCYHSRFAS